MILEQPSPLRPGARPRHHARRRARHPRLRTERVRGTASRAGLSLAPHRRRSTAWRSGGPRARAPLREPRTHGVAPVSGSSGRSTSPAPSQRAHRQAGPPHGSTCAARCAQRSEQPREKHVRPWRGWPWRQIVRPPRAPLQAGGDFPSTRAALLRAIALPLRESLFRATRRLAQGVDNAVALSQSLGPASGTCCPSPPMRRPQPTTISTARLSAADWR